MQDNHSYLAFKLIKFDRARGGTLFLCESLDPVAERFVPGRRWRSSSRTTSIKLASDHGSEEEAMAVIDSVSRPNWQGYP